MGHPILLILRDCWMEQAEKTAKEHKGHETQKTLYMAMVVHWSSVACDATRIAGSGEGRPISGSRVRVTRHG